MPADGEAPPEIEFSEHEGYLEVRFLGVFKADRFNRQVDAAVEACGKRNVRTLLIDVIGLQFPKLSTVDRYEIGAHGARVASHLRVAVFGPPGPLESKSFGAKVAQNRGLSTLTFTDRQKAVEWLTAPQ